MRGAGRVALAIVLVATITAAEAAAATTAATTTRLTTGARDSRPCVTIDRDGATHMAFRREGHGPGTWYSTNRSGAWRTNRVLGPTIASCVDIAVDRRGRASILLTGGDDVRLLTNRSGAWRNVLVSGSEPNDASMAIDALGRPAVALADGSGIRLLVLQAGRWRGARIVRSTDVRDISGLRYSPGGSAHLAYATSGSVLRVTNRSGTWRRSIVGGEDHASGVGLAVDQLGRAIVSYDAGGRFRVRLERSGRWPISLQRLGSGFDDLSADERGGIHLLRSSGSEAGLQYFRYRSGRWASRTIARPSDEALPALAVDRLGRALVVIAEDGYLRRLSNRTGSWITRVHTATTFDSIGAIAAGPAGSVSIAAKRHGRTPGIVVLTRSTPAGSWITQRVSSDAADGVPSLAIDPGGRRHLAWLRDGSVWYATDATGSWQAEQVSDEGFDAFALIDGAGTVHVLYGIVAGRVDAARVGAGWTRTTSPVASTCRAAVSDASGAFHLACGSSVVIHVTNSGGAWSSTLVVGEGTYPLNAAMPASIAVDGASVAIGYTADDGISSEHQEAWVAIRSGGTWTTERLRILARSPQLGFVGGAATAIVSTGDGTAELFTRTGTTWTASELPLPAAAVESRITVAPGVQGVVALGPGGYGYAERLGTPSQDGGLWYVED